MNKGQRAAVLEKLEAFFLDKLPDFRVHRLSTDELKWAMPGVGLLMREFLSDGKFIILAVFVGLENQDRFSVRVGWQCLEELGPLMVRDSMPVERDGVLFPRPTSAWGLCPIEFLAGSNVALGWELDCRSAQGLQRTLDDAVRAIELILVPCVQKFRQRILETAFEPKPFRLIGPYALSRPKSE